MATKTSKIEKELLGSVSIKEQKKGENRQDYFDRLIKAVGALADDDWEGLSETAQKWVNKGQKIINDDSGDIPEFPDLKGGADEEEDDEKPKSRRGRDADEEEEEKPRSRRGSSKDAEEEEAGGEDDAEEEKEKPRSRRGRDKDEDEDEEDEKPKSRRGRKDEDEEEEEEKPKSRRGSDKDEEEEDEKPRSRRGRDKDEEEEEDEKPKSRRGRDKDEEEEEEKPARRGASKDKGKGGAQVEIKRMVIKKPSIDTDAIASALDKKGIDATPSAISTIRSGTLQTLRLIKEIGMPKGDI